jgi:hypothetical protein
MVVQQNSYCFYFYLTHHTCASLTLPLLLVERGKALLAGLGVSKKTKMILLNNSFRYSKFKIYYKREKCHIRSDIPSKMEKPGKCYICSQHTWFLYCNWNKVREKVRLAIVLKNLD